MPFLMIWGRTDFLSLEHCDIATVEMSDMPQLKCLTLEHCDIATVEIAETSTMCGEARQMSVFATEDICLVSTADICPVSAAGICPVSTADICPVSTCTSKDWKAH